jgi:phosphatidylinositol 3-kinase
MQTRCQLEGVRHPRPFTVLIDKPELRFHGVQSSYARLPYVQYSLPVVPNVLHSALSDIFVTCQLLADNKPLTIPFQTSHKTFKNSYTSVFSLTVLKSLADFSYQVERMDHATDPLL